MRSRVLRGIVFGVGPILWAHPNLQAQDCQALPTGESEIWIGAEARWNGQAGAVGGQLVANVADFLGMEFGAGTGGYTDGAESPQQVHLRIAPLLGLGSVRICPLVELRSHSRDVRASFRVDRGRIEEKGLGMGTVVAGSLPPWFGSRLGWQATAGLAFRDWDLKGRRLLVEEEVRVEEVHWARHSAHLFGTLGITARFGVFGLVTGLGTRPHDEADFFGFISLGLRLSG